MPPLWLFKPAYNTRAIVSALKYQFNGDLLIPPPVLNETDNSNPRNYDIGQVDLRWRSGHPQLGWRAIARLSLSLAIRAVENLALDFGYGGPHSMLSRVGSFKSPGGTVGDQNP